MDYYNYIDNLELVYKIEYLDSGAFATVYQHPTYHNVVVKVFNSDKAYASYLQWCTKHQDNPYVPQIADIKQVKNECIVVFLEKLKKSTNQARLVLCKQIVANCPALRGEISNRGMAYIDMLVWRDWKYIAKNTSDTYLSQLARFLARTNHEIDLHGGNIMMRSNGQLVFTDPIA